MEAVHTGVALALALDCDLIIAGASNSLALELLVPGRMRDAITAEHHIWLLLLDHVKEYGICFVEFFLIFVQASSVHRDLVKGERVEAAYLLQATPSNCLADFVNTNISQSLLFGGDLGNSVGALLAAEGQSRHRLWSPAWLAILQN
jgi:hypothetical protein